jgi:hypothetical protein
LVEISVSSNAMPSITAHESCKRKVCICLTFMKNSNTYLTTNYPCKWVRHLVATG